MGRLMKAFGKGTSAACVEDCDDSDGDPFVPNDFAEGDPFQASEESQMDDPDFDKALYEFYVSRKVNCLKWKITDAGARNVSYKANCLLKFVRTEVPLRFVKWLASKFDVLASEIQIRKKFIPISKYVIHDILDLPVDGEPIVSDVEAGHEFILSHFNVTRDVFGSRDSFEWLWISLTTWLEIANFSVWLGEMPSG
ncbi:hypothetical protein VPH35_077870 [Triticum aestivum]|uniref:Uncharacterized protein n=1 Tax=Aegilops tauschii TaxID=37682 RepID=M8BP69_AEGTA